MGINYLHLLTIVFVVLKLIGIIAWPWWTILLPSIISVGATVILIILEIIEGK